MDKNELSEKMKTPEIMEQNKLQIAHVLRDRASTTRISNLYIKKNKLPVALITKGDKLRPMVELVFFYDRPSWILRTSENDPLIPGVDSRELRLPVYLKEKVQLITLKAMGPISETEIETFYVYSPEAQELKFESSWDQLILSIGAASFNYFQTHYGYYKSYTGYFSMRRAPSFDKTEKWGLLAEVQATTLTFWASPIQSGPQIIQGKGDILIWLSPQEVQQWRAQYYVGMNYLTMLANNSPFGFSNLFSPDIGGLSSPT